MEKTQDFCLSLQHREPGSRILQHDSNTCRCGGYIIERIIEQRHEDVRFDGLIALTGLPEYFSAPLTLCRILVEDIRPIRSCCDSSMIWLHLALSCYVMDRCGRRAAGKASIEICISALWTRVCGANILRGAQIQIADAAFLTPCTFHARLDIHVNTIVTQCGMTGNPPECHSSCANLPLYPKVSVHSPCRTC